MKITIAGFSSVGKKTLINSLLKEDKYRLRLGVTRSIEAFGYSFLPLDKMPHSKADTIIFQWQFDIHDMISNSNKIYILWRDYEQHRLDWIKIYSQKYPWIAETTSDYLKKKWHDVIDRFQGLDYEVVNITNWFK